MYPVLDIGVPIAIIDLVVQKAVAKKEETVLMPVSTEASPHAYCSAAQHSTPPSSLLTRTGAADQTKSRQVKARQKKSSNLALCKLATWFVCYMAILHTNASCCVPCVPCELRASVQCVPSHGMST